MRSSPISLLILLVTGLLAAPQVRAADRVAVVVGIDNVQGFGSDLAITGAEDRAVALREALLKAGFGRVAVIAGGTPNSAEAIQTALEDALSHVDPGGMLLWVFEGHGIGGDYGDAQLLGGTSASEGIDVARLPVDLGARLGNRKLVVLTDAVHAGKHDGGALIGPVAADWYNTGEKFAVISATGPGQVATTGLFIQTLTDAIGGPADKDQDGRITIGELVSHLRTEVGDTSGGRMHPGRAGDLADGHVLMTPAPRDPAPRDPPPPQPQPVHPPVVEQPVVQSFTRPASYVALATGTAMGLASLVMYAAKRSSCQQTIQGLACGNNTGYTSYRRIQHTTGWLGGGLVLAGVGLQFLDMGPVSMGPGAVHLSGRY